MEIFDINAKKIYIEIYYVSLINSTFTIKAIYIIKCPYNRLEDGICSLINEGSIIFLGEFNARTTTNQPIILSNDYKTNHLWLVEDLVLAINFKINFEYMFDNLFNTKIIKVYSSKYVTICNGVMKWPKSNQMNCIHGLTVRDDVIYNIPKYNLISNVAILNGHDLYSNHRVPLTLT